MLMYDRQFAVAGILVFTGKESLLLVNIYNPYVKIKLLEAIRRKGNHFVYKVWNENGICFYL